VLFFGHIAVSLALADATDSDAGAAVAGNLLPDVADKTLGLVLGWTPSRWLAHGMPCAALACVVARRWMAPRAWRGFTLGYTSHLLGDLWAGGEVPWLAPFLGDSRRRRSRYDRAWFLANLGPEVAGLAFLLRRGRRGPAR
jgi:membrane-bound metal-dependent hydrolase YbcI (DUF457 family)